MWRNKVTINQTENGWLVEFNYNNTQWVFTSLEDATKLAADLLRTQAEELEKARTK